MCETALVSDWLYCRCEGAESGSLSRFVWPASMVVVGMVGKAAIIARDASLPMAVESFATKSAGATST
jgi:hypothetical protein